MIPLFTNFFLFFGFMFTLSLVIIIIRSSASMRMKEILFVIFIVSTVTLIIFATLPYDNEDTTTNVIATYDGYTTYEDNPLETTVSYMENSSYGIAESGAMMEKTLASYKNNEITKEEFENLLNEHNEKSLIPLENAINEYTYDGEILTEHQVILDDYNKYALETIHALRQFNTFTKEPNDEFTSIFIKWNENKISMAEEYGKLMKISYQ